MLSEPFGATGHYSTRLLFGAAAFYDVTQLEADKTMELVIEKGINHIDTAVNYGKAELRLGPWIKHYRERFFLATKTDQRTRKGALEELKGSLDRLHTDHVDLWQMHLLIDQDDWECTFGPGGALEAFQEAREQGLVKYLGVTGHELVAPEMHLESLKRFAFDSVLLPYNYALMDIPRYRDPFEKLYKIARKRQIAFQCIKTICRSPKEEAFATWYRPFDEQDDIDILIGWALQRKSIFINSAADTTLFPKVVAAAERFEPERDYVMDMKALAKAKGMKSLFI